MNIKNNKVAIYSTIILSGIGIMIKNEQNWGPKITSCAITGTLIITLGGVLLTQELYLTNKYIKCNSKI